MPKNKGKGGKTRRRGRANNNTDDELIEKQEGQVYAQILRILGNNHVELSCFDGKMRLGYIAGKLQKRAWMRRDDVVLVNLRDYQDDKADIIVRYTPAQVKMLKKSGALSATLCIDEDASDDDRDLMFDFDGERDEDDNPQGTPSTVGEQSTRVGMIPPSDDEDDSDPDLDEL